MCTCNAQAFTSRVFYNAETGCFERVTGEGVRGGWVEDEDAGVTPSSSLDTLYLTDDAVGPVSL